MSFLYMILSTFTSFLNPELESLKLRLNQVSYIQKYQPLNHALQSQKQEQRNFFTPSIQIGIRNLPTDFSYLSSPMTGNSFSISQQFKTNGVFKTKKEMLNTNIQQNKIEASLVKQQAFIQIAKHYYNLFYIQKKHKHQLEKKQLYKKLHQYLSSIKEHRNVELLALKKVKAQEVNQTLILMELKRKELQILNNIQLLLETNTLKAPFTFHGLNQKLLTWKLPEPPKNFLSVKHINSSLRILNKKQNYLKAMNTPKFKLSFTWLQRFEQSMSNGDDLFSLVFSMDLPYFDSPYSHKQLANLHQIKAVTFNRNYKQNSIQHQLSLYRKLFLSYQQSLKLCQNELKTILKQSITLNHQYTAYETSSLEQTLSLKEKLLNAEIQCLNLSMKTVDAYFNYLYHGI